MKTEVHVPNLPESVADATLIAWHKKAGDSVQQDENLVDLETDKVVLEVPAPENGVLSEIKQPDGATVTSGDLLAIIDSVQADEPIVKSSMPVEPHEAEQPSENPLSPAVRRLILENNIDPGLIKGTGKSGRLTKSDVLSYLQQQSSSTQSPISEPAATIKPAATVTPISSAKPMGTQQESRPEQRVAMTRLRARVAERLIQAQQNAAMLTTFNEVNLNRVIELRKQYKDQFLKKHQIKLGFMSFFIKACIEGLRKFPVVNASVDGQDIIYHGYYDIGIAVSSERGLVVPILRDANRLDFSTIEKQLSDFGEKARTGGLSYDELSGGTFTITNGGVFGSMMSTPILNPPQSAILGMHTIQQRPVVEHGEIVVRPMMYLALTYDHRIIDGREAVQFLLTIKECLEDPARLLLNV